MTRFLLPSIAGGLLFFSPVFYGGKATIPMAIMVDWLREFMGPVTAVLVIAVCLGTTVPSVLYSWCNAPWLPKNDTTERLFNVSPVEILFALIGTVVGIMVWLQVGPEIIIGEDTGKIAFVEIGGNLLLILFLDAFYSRCLQISASWNLSVRWRNRFLHDCLACQGDLHLTLLRHSSSHRTSA